MSRMRMAVLAAVAVMAFTTAPALAMTMGGEVFGAFDTHAMSDWKDFTDVVNASGGSIDDPKSSFGGGLGLRMWPNSNWMLAATWEPVFLTRKEDVSGDKLNLNANSFQATAGYFFPTAGPAKLGLGAGLGVYVMGGKIESAGSPDVDLTGTALGFHVLGMMEWTVSPGFAVTGGAGYRYAKISDTQFNDHSFGTFTGTGAPDFETDYSGLMLRAGLAFYMPSSGSNH